MLSGKQKPRQKCGGSLSPRSLRNTSCPRWIRLSQEELKAVIAHELGHVWIFSHFPYLQTEILANEIAMRAVSRDSMKKIYAKLWLRLGTTGDLEAVLGSDKDEPKTPFPATASAAPRH